jgi:plastocyanin domain-containing protein
MKSTILSIVIATVLIGGAVILTKNNGTQQESTNNISVVDGKQIIEIKAKGGYSPRVTVAQANIPTVLRVTTNSTFDCSIGLSIPKLNFRENLSPTGVKEIEVPAQAAGSEMRGVCSMGMYNFAVKFN